MKVSIITIVYNNKPNISDCIQSVLDQTYPNIEHIVIDGGSTDGTQDVIEFFKEKLSYYISEKDRGLYNALNKGIQQATGDIIGFMFSDDIFYESTTISKVVKEFENTQADLLYANGLYLDKNDSTQIKRIYKAKKYHKRYLPFGWIPLHTTFFIQREVFNKYGLYDESYSISSDYEISLRWFKNDRIKKIFLNEWVVKMRLGGKSTTVKFQKKKSSEDLAIIRKYKLWGCITLGFKIGRKIPQYILPRVMKIHI
jgi:glycosyltransferase involved in cell wall biosynthesis